MNNIIEQYTHMESIEHEITGFIHIYEKLEAQMKERSEFSFLTHRQSRCLELIDELRNPTATDLSEAMDITRTSISAMLEKLEFTATIHLEPRKNSSEPGS